ncbi:YolD-like family protein [Paenibacillus kribbensis]|uniref:YolD-like family protein n=1 Tax=Paenibacillus TaxID=44249 RepID=UPI00024EFAFF|nr:MULTISPECIES: YolD-like family protein [Paenibacillus]EHS57827.1 YolD-like protein [Paenibacillus sp. Aloe-11]MEC0180988.1 YolD-like family protein [Paenibacillus peoriae]MEC0236498.1 YolD-like family protein [Paenibacillus kribbensis]
MGKKLEGNGIWESSRMILPEHRDAYLRLMKEQGRRDKPTLDDQEMWQIEQALIISYNERKSITLRVFNPFDDEELCGLVTVINTSRREVKLSRGEEDFSWIKLEEIIEANI